jgi:hypothetical protein
MKPHDPIASPASRTAPNPRSPPEHYTSLPSLSRGLKLDPRVHMQMVEFVSLSPSLPLSLSVKSLHRPWYRCLLMVVDPAPSLRGTAGHSSIPPFRQVRRRRCEWRIPVKIRWLHRNLLDAPRADVLIEDSGCLQRSQGRVAVWSERRSRSEGMGDGRRRHGDARAATRGMEEHVQRT